MSSRIEIQVLGGPSIELRALNQSLTYGGLLEGIPTVEMNHELRLAALGAGRSFAHAEPLLIPPAETPIQMSRPYPLGVPSKMPAVQCIGRWQGPLETRGDEVGWTKLTIIWYQEDWAMPIAPEVAAQIQALDWSRHAIFDEA